MHYIYNFLSLGFQDTDENGKTGGEVEVPLQSVAKGEVAAGSSNYLHNLKIEAISHICNESEPNILFTLVAESIDMDTSTLETNTGDMYTGLTVNSAVEVTFMSGNGYGTIRWIGMLPDRQEIMAGLELVRFLQTCYCTDSYQHSLNHCCRFVEPLHLK